MLIGTNMIYASSYNKRIIMEAIRLYGPLSRVEIARKTRLTAQTITNITKNLMKAGLIVEDSRKTIGPGAPSIMLKLNEKAGFSVGIDFDKDHLTTILIDFCGRICRKKTQELHYPDPENAVELMAASVLHVLEKERVDRDRVLGVGVGVPGPFAVSEQRNAISIVNPVAFPEWKDVPVTHLLEKQLQMPILLENNASASAIGEYWYGDGKHLNSFFYIYFGAGLGGGIVINGQLYSGHTSNAGELGYFPTSTLMNSGSEFDHLGGYFDIPRFQKRLGRLGYNASTIEQLGALHTQKIPELTEWLNTGSRSLIPLILGIEYLLDPEVIFFGGRLPDTILHSIIERIEVLWPAQNVGKKSKRPAFKLASAGMETAARGVASLPLYASFAPQHKLLMRQKSYTGQGKSPGGAVSAPDNSPSQMDKDHTSI